jgi:hypothetical protein
VPNLSIYAAPSLFEVMKQLSFYRPTGVLTIWRATGARQEDTRITIELGRPLHVYRGSHWENATESILAWLNTWGEIHFSFQSTEARLRLPSPAFSAPAQSTLLQHNPLSTNTQPQQALPINSRATQPFPFRIMNQQAQVLPGNSGRTRELPIPPIPPIPSDHLHQEGQNGLTTSSGRSSASGTGENAVASLTHYGRTFPPTNLPRYDRTIFLLINGRRTVSDLSQLTNRRTEEIYTTLHRLQSLQIIALETLPTQP